MHAAFGKQKRSSSLTFSIIAEWSGAAPALPHKECNASPNLASATDRSACVAQRQRICFVIRRLSVQIAPQAYMQIWSKG